jgi:hypothetical protein
MNKAIVTKVQLENPAPGVHSRDVLSPGDYTYSSMWGVELSGSSIPSLGRRQGGGAGFSSCGLRCRRRWPIGVDDVVGVSGLMSSNVPICMHLNLWLFAVFAVYIGSFVNIFGTIVGRGRPRDCPVRLLSGWLCENQSDITGLY